MPFKEALKSYRKSFGLTQQQLADKLGFSKSTISMWECGNRDPNSEDLVRLSELFGVSVNDLLGIEVPAGVHLGSTFIFDPLIVKATMLDDIGRSKAEAYMDSLISGTSTDHTDIDSIYDALNLSGRQSLCSYGRYLGSQAEYRAARPAPAAARVIPLLGASFAAGTPEAPGDLFMQDYETSNPLSEFAIHINGNSMEPYLPDGSVAEGVKREPRNGEVGAFWLDGGFLVKQYCGDSSGNVYLLSLNRDRSDADETVWHDSGRDLRCVGTILMPHPVPLP